MFANAPPFYFAHISWCDFNEWIWIRITKSIPKQSLLELVRGGPRKSVTNQLSTASTESIPEFFFSTLLRLKARLLFCVQTFKVSAN